MKLNKEILWWKEDDYSQLTKDQKEQILRGLWIEKIYPYLDKHKIISKHKIWPTNMKSY